MKTLAPVVLLVAVGVLSGCGQSGSSQGKSAEEGKVSAADALMAGKESGVLVVPRKLPDGYKLTKIVHDNGPGTSNVAAKGAKRTLASFDGPKGAFTMCGTKGENFEKFCVAEANTKGGHKFGGDISGVNWASWSFPVELAPEMKKEGPFDATRQVELVKWAPLQKDPVATK